jgi:hypothetical protein
MDTQTTVVVFAILAAFGLIAIVAVDIVLTAQEAEAKGCTPGGVYCKSLTFLK